MRNFRHFPLPTIAVSVAAAVTVFSTSSARAASIMENYSFGGLALGIPDGNPSGLTDTHSISGSRITHIESITVTLDLSGSFNGDLYAYLTNGSDISILLNRVGSASGNTFGYDHDGFNITLDDLAATNVHSYGSLITPAIGSPLTGSWQPDGRLIDPNLVLDTDAPTANLSAFVGGDLNGDWTLFVADLSSGDNHVLESWSLQVVGIPEPSSILGLACLLGSGIMLRTRRLV